MDLLSLAGAAIGAVAVLLLIAVSKLPGDGPGLAELFKASTDLGWPRGVQEEEPVRWRVELLEPSTRRAIPPGREAPATGRVGTNQARRPAPTYPTT